MFLEELDKISNLITDIIKNDDFPNGVKPDHLKDAISSYPMRPGKRLRPALLMWTCGMLDGDISQTEFAAAAVELYHNWTLVHDDIIDEDELRRGLPATHSGLETLAIEKYKLDKLKAKKFGLDFGILAGDLQHSWAMNLMLKTVEKGVPSNIVIFLCRELCETLSKELISGEALDVDFSYRDFSDVSLTDIEKIMQLKTSSLLEYSVITGARIALQKENDERIQKVADFAAAMGIAFQLRDDWLGIFSEIESFGKPLGSDICSAKPTMLTIKTLENLKSKEKDRFLSYLGKPEIAFDQLEEIRSLIRKSDAENYVLNKMSELKNIADKALDEFPENKHKKLLLELNNYLISRTH